MSNKCQKQKKNKIKTKKIKQKERVVLWKFIYFDFV